MQLYNLTSFLSSNERWDRVSPGCWPFPNYSQLCHQLLRYNSNQQKNLNNCYVESLHWLCSQRWRAAREAGGLLNHSVWWEGRRCESFRKDSWFTWECGGWCFIAEVARSLSASWMQGLCSSAKYSDPVHFRSLTHSCSTLCDPMDCNTKGFPVHHQIPVLAQAQVNDDVQPSHPLSSPSPPVFTA